MLSICLVCGWVYDRRKGDPENGVKPGTPFESLPSGWVCPFCKAKRTYFVPFINRLVRWDMGERLAKLVTMSAVDVMAEEHRIIERMLSVMASAQARLKKEEEVPAAAFLAAAGFLRDFADGYHHGKEEDILFPAFEDQGMARARGPIGVLLQEHAEGRRLVRAFADATAEYQRSGAKAALRVADSLEPLFNLYRGHIAKEDSYVFPRGAQLLGTAGLKRVLVDFRKFDEQTGGNKREEYLKLIEKMEKELGSISLETLEPPQAF